MSVLFNSKNDNKEELENYTGDDDFIYEHISADINKIIPNTTDNISLLIKKNSKLLQLSNYLFSNLSDFLPPNAILLVFDKKATLLEKIYKDDCPVLDNQYFKKGALWSTGYGDDPVGASLNKGKVTICEIVTANKTSTKWTLITTPINPKSPSGAVSIMVPSKYFSRSLLSLFKFMCDFISMSLGNQITLSETQSYFEQMFGGLAHEVKNILTTIRGFVQLLSKEEENPDKIGYSNLILSELDRAHGILKNSIFYSSSKEQRVNLCRISDIISEVINNLHAVITNSNISLNLNIDYDLPYITGDSTQFRQVFLNIIQNAIEAMPNGGTLSIDCYVNNLQIHTVIKDTGPGMPASVRNKIFLPFYSTKHGGTGLGLSVSKQVIEQYKGQIFVRSTKNKGTSFTIILPM